MINGCTPIKFDIYSFQNSQQLVILPWFEEDSFYMITESSSRVIILNFVACIECPIGFKKTNNDVKGCDCVCNRILRSYIINCNYTRETITKKGTTAWITYLRIKNTSDYLIYPHCPMDYCHPPDTMIEINLNTPNGADACSVCSQSLWNTLWNMQPWTKPISR